MKAIFLQLTTSCNARSTNCPHPFTYGKYGHHQKGLMSNEVWQKVLRDIITIGYRGQVGFYLHHEPLLAPSLFHKIKDVNESTNAFVVLSTNTFLLNEETRTKLIDAKPRLVHININSSDKTQYEEQTGLDFQTVIKNTKKFIHEAVGKLRVEINCPVLPSTDTKKLVELFHQVKVNIKYWANSRGGLLPNIRTTGKITRFSTSQYCFQPTQNFNILFDGSVILCCNDWLHESKNDFPNILEQPILDIYRGRSMLNIVSEFKNGHYTRYRMCKACAKEMGYNICLL